MDVEKLADFIVSNAGSYGLISAYVHGESESSNMKRNSLLAHDLALLGYRFTEYNGVWEGTRERSFCVYSIKPDDLISLGKKYGQKAVMYVSSSVRKLTYIP